MVPGRRRPRWCPCTPSRRDTRSDARRIFSHSITMGLRVGFIGSGMMAEALAGGFDAAGVAKFTDMSCIDRNKPRRELFASWGVTPARTTTRWRRIATLSLSPSSPTASPRCSARCARLFPRIPSSSPSRPGSPSPTWRKLRVPASPSFALCPIPPASSAPSPRAWPSALPATPPTPRLASSSSTRWASATSSPRVSSTPSPASAAPPRVHLPHHRGHGGRRRARGSAT